MRWRRYKDHTYTMTRWPGIPTIENYESHPFLPALESGELDAEIAAGAPLADRSASSSLDLSRAGSASSLPPSRGPSPAPPVPARPRPPHPPPSLPCSSLPWSSHEARWRQILLPARATARWTRFPSPQAKRARLRDVWCGVGHSLHHASSCCCQHAGEDASAACVDETQDTTLEFKARSTRGAASVGRLTGGAAGF